MMSMMKITALLVSGMALSGCVTEAFEGTEPYRGSESIIATGQDQGRDTGVLTNGVAAIAYDPDGCQIRVLDDGLEGYSTRRFDPVSGLPVCNNNFPPGTVLGNYQTGTEGIEDRVSGTGIRTVVNR